MEPANLGSLTDSSGPPEDINVGTSHQSDTPSMPKTDTINTPHAGGANMELAVVGAHLSGFPLNKDLTSLGACLQACTTTSPQYKLYALHGTTLEKPGLILVPDNGACIEIEIWDIPMHAVGRFLSTIPSPLGLGSVEVKDGRWVKGFICEAYGLRGAKDVTEHKGWRNYKKSLVSD